MLQARVQSLYRREGHSIAVDLQDGAIARSHLEGSVEVLSHRADVSNAGWLRLVAPRRQRETSEFFESRVRVHGVKVLLLIAIADGTALIATCRRARVDLNDRRPATLEARAAGGREAAFSVARACTTTGRSAGCTTAAAAAASAGRCACRAARSFSVAGTASTSSCHRSQRDQGNCEDGIFRHGISLLGDPV